jgi:hypothetical protein
MIGSSGSRIASVSIVRASLLSTRRPLEAIDGGTGRNLAYDCDLSSALIATGAGYHPVRGFGLVHG